MNFDGEVHGSEDVAHAGSSGHGHDDEQQVFKRAKRNVDTLVRARKNERSIR